MLVALRQVISSTWPLRTPYLLKSGLTGTSGHHVGSLGTLAMTGSLCVVTGRVTRHFSAQDHVTDKAFVGVLTKPWSNSVTLEVKPEETLMKAR